MLATGAQEGEKLTPSSMDDPSANVFEYSSYQLSISIVLTLNDILGRSILVPGSNN